MGIFGDRTPPLTVREGRDVMGYHSRRDFGTCGRRRWIAKQAEAEARLIRYRRIAAAVALLIAYGVMVWACFFGPAAHAEAPPFNRTDTALFTAYSGLMAVDYGQTRYIAAHPGRYWEINPLLGRHPSGARVSRYFIASYAATFLVGRYALRGDWRTGWLAAHLALEAALVMHNHAVGIALRW